MICCFPSVKELSERLSLDFLSYLTHASGYQKTIAIALSGGKTPKAIFERIAADSPTLGNLIVWKKVHFFWVDERCVPPEHADSNFGMTNESLFSGINLNEANIHRIHGEDDPYQEALRYATEIKKIVEMKNEIPVFDCIFLGIGDDGHTASIFPDRMDLLNANCICEAVIHPVNGQSRITLTGKPLLKAKKLIVLATGQSKSTVISKIMNNTPESKTFPAAQILRLRNNADWYIDKEAAKYLNISCHG